MWSADVGYPADPMYRDFYRDIGWDLPQDALAPMVGPGRPRRATGFKYHRITGRGADKAVWAPEPAFARAREHARHFVARVRARTEALVGRMERDPLVVAPYDAELFGHWWFEGPVFLEALFREAAAAGLAVVTPADDLQAWPEAQVVSPVESSWGEHGHASMWLDPVNDWIPQALYGCAQMLAPFARLRAHRRDRGAGAGAGIPRAAPRPVVGLRLHPPERHRHCLRPGARAVDISPHSWSSFAQSASLRWIHCGCTSLEERDALFPDLALASFRE